MTLSKSTVGKCFIVAFCLWHMCAVLIYTVPRIAEDPFATLAKERLIPRITPYLLVTSQWQLWDLFSPDPMRRITVYDIQAKQNGIWTTVEHIAPGSYPWWEHAARFKLLLNTLDEFNVRKEVRLKFLQLQCRDHALVADTPIRLQMTYYVIPIPQRGERTWWKKPLPSMKTYTAIDTLCPPRS